ncbi:MAG: CPBP family intramembrane metalloprotease [Firmicutes bacterium]|nr:CPBP family intramembrane metalloprotease [Bacillota bacterium]
MVRLRENKFTINNRNILLSFIITLFSAFIFKFLHRVGVIIFFVTKFQNKELDQSTIDIIIKGDLGLQALLYLGVELLFLLITYLFMNIVERGEFSIFNIDYKLTKENKILLLYFTITIITFKVISYFLFDHLGLVDINFIGFSKFLVGEIIGFALFMIIISSIKALCEEIYFRYYLLDRTKKYIGDIIGGLFTSFLFSLLYVLIYFKFNLEILILFILALFIGYIYLKTNSLFLTIGTHAIWFFTGGLIKGKGVFFSNEGIFLLKNINEFSPLFLTFVDLITILLLILIFKNREIIKDHLH